MYHKTKVEIAIRNDSLKREVAFLGALRKIKEEMDRAWEDFFEKNPDKKEEDVRRLLEERLRNKQNSKNLDRGV
jgi:F420-dependent methylenetetrahydromethanopterin dehydrogenase